LFDRRHTDHATALGTFYEDLMIFGEERVFLPSKVGLWPAIPVFTETGKEVLRDSGYTEADPESDEVAYDM